MIRILLVFLFFVPTSVFAVDSLVVGIENRLLDAEPSKMLQLSAVWSWGEASSWGLTASALTSKIERTEGDSSGPGDSFETDISSFGGFLRKVVPIRKGSVKEYAQFGFGVGEILEDNKTRGFSSDDKFVYIEPAVYSVHKVSKKLNLLWGFSLFVPLDLIFEDGGDRDQIPGQVDEVSVEEAFTVKASLKLEYSL